MIQIVLNGEAKTLPAAMTCAGLIAHLSPTGKRVAIERNGDIVPKSRHDQEWLADGDRLELVVAVGGG
jgi:sulfur carrier protein